MRAVPTAGYREGQPRGGRGRCESAIPAMEGEIEADESRTESRSQPALTLRDALPQMSCRRRDPNGHHYTDGNKGCERDLLYPAGRAGHGDREGDRNGSQDNQQHNTCHSNQDDHFLTVLLRQTRPYGSDGRNRQLRLARRLLAARAHVCRSARCCLGLGAITRW
jgi:hypothetical protein